MDDSHTLPSHDCPACGTRLDAATSICEGTPAPRPGDVTICIDCTAVMMFAEDLTVRLVKPGEIRDRDALRDIRRAQRAIRRAQEERPS